MPRKRGGYLPSEYDGRDIPWRTNDTLLLPSVQLYRPPIRDQGTEIDCCTSMALATAFEIVDQRDGSGTLLSSLFHYYFARRKPQYLGYVTLRQALQTAAVKGFCRLDLHDKPIIISGAFDEPSEDAIEDAKERCLLGYDPITGTAGYFGLDGNNRYERWKRSLSLGFPIIAGIWTQSSYWAGQGIKTDQAERHQGAHAVCIVGFDDSQGAFNVRDSRGASFATEGEWELSYEVVSSGRIIESWTIRTLTYND